MIEREPASQTASGRREWVQRLDRMAADLNVVLTIFAIGLATLDLTFLVTQRVIDRLPELTRVQYVEHHVPASMPAAQRELP
jgi:hypothetical protein